MLWYVDQRWPGLQPQLLPQAQQFIHKHLHYYNTRRLSPGFFLYNNFVLCLMLRGYTLPLLKTKIILVFKIGNGMSKIGNMVGTGTFRI